MCVCVCVCFWLYLSLYLPPPLSLSVTNDEEGMHTGKDVCPACRPSEERR